MRTERIDPRDPDRLVYGGLIALAQATVFQLTDRPLTTPGKWAVGLFAAAMPLLAACVLSSIARSRAEPPRAQSRVGAAVGLLGSGLAVCGFGAFFCDLNAYYVIPFLTTAAIAAAAFRRM